MPGEQIEGDMVYDIAKVAALLHRAADMDQKPSIKETKFLLPKPALSAKDIKPPQWVNMVSFFIIFCKGLSGIFKYQNTKFVFSATYC